MTGERTTSAWIQAHPNPVLADATGAGATTLSWSFSGTDAVEVRVGAPDGPLLSHTADSGSMSTGKWVQDGMVFYLQDVSGGAPLTAEHTLATVRVKVDRLADTSGPKALILLYHRVANIQPDPWSFCVTPQRFAEHMEVLFRQWRVTRLGELVRALQEGRIRDRSVVVTFDDGYADNLYFAKPILESHRAPATVFIASGYIGGRREFWWDELERLLRRDGNLNLDLYRSLHRMLQPLADVERQKMLDGLREWAGAEPVARSTHSTLNCAELIELTHGDLIEAGSHTATHSLLTAATEAHQRSEIAHCKDALERMLGRRIDHFSYPYGRYSEATIEIVRRAGFACACTTHAAVVDKYSDRYQLPRFVVGDWDGGEFADRLSDWYSSASRRAPEAAGLSVEADASAARARDGAGVSRELSAERLGRAEQVRLETEAGVQAFQVHFDHVLRMYRNQRAWRAMLLLRKGYTLLVQKRDVAGFIKWVARLFSRKDGDLAQCDLSFPRIENFIPPAIRTSFLEFKALPKHPSSETRQIPRQTKYDLIVLPVFEFDFRFQRPQQLASQFARNGHRVFWVSPSRRAPPSSTEGYEVLPLKENFWEVHLRGRCPSIYSEGLSGDSSSELVRSLGALYRDWSIAESVVVIELPFWRSVGLGLRESFGARVVFDCMDDWESMPLISEFNRQEERLLVKECDLLVLTARQLADKYATVARRSVLAPNAADFSAFDDQSAGHPGLDGISKPIVGYFGAIADWFDYDLFYEVVTTRPQYSFVLIGGLGLEDEVQGDRIARFRELPNVFLLGHKPYSELPSYLRHFDACVIPFVINDVTRATDPVKVYEYLSQGKPVVATAMPELSDRSDLIYIARDPGDFARKLDLAVTECAPELKRRRLSYAAANTWRDRMEIIDAAVRETFPPVSILIVTHNSQDFVRPCLESILRNTSYPNWEILIADNGSSDDTVQRLSEYAEAEPRIRIIELNENKGFAAANNVVARIAGGEYLILLNIDTMVTPGWIGRLVRHHQKRSSVGIVVPVTNWAGNEVRINTDYVNFREMEEFALVLAGRNAGLTLEVDVAPLFCALIPRDVWSQTGELDERFEVGMFEDDDYSIRVRQSGRRIVAAEDCFVHHFGRGSFSKLSRDEYQRVFDQNLRRFEEKWTKPWAQHKYRPGVRPECAQHNPAEFYIPPAGQL